MEGPSCMFQVYVLGFLAPSQRLSRASTRPQRFSQRLFGQVGGRRNVDLVRQIRQDVGIRLETLWMRGPTGDWISGSPKNRTKSSPTHGISHQVAKKNSNPQRRYTKSGTVSHGDVLVGRSGEITQKSRKDWKDPQETAERSPTIGTSPKLRGCINAPSSHEKSTK